MPDTDTKTISRQRARSPEDKDLRRAQLIAAAAQLFASADFEDVTIAQVAQAAGLAKGTAYIYFATKETLFLELVRAELTAWLDTLVRKLNRVRAQNRIEAVSAALAHSVAQRPALRRLLVLLHSVIEPKIDEECALAFKYFLLDTLTQASTAIANKVPSLHADQAATVVLQLHALVIGLAQLANPAPVVTRVLKLHPPLQAMQIDFEPFLASTLSTLLRGTLCGSALSAVHDSL